MDVRGLAIVWGSVGALLLYLSYHGLEFNSTKPSSLQLSSLDSTVVAGKHGTTELHCNLMLLFLWPACLDFFIAFSYLTNPNLGTWALKKSLIDGSFPLLRLIAFLPWLVQLWTCWLFITHVVVREAQHDKVFDEFFIGRYPLEALPAQITVVVDLTAEFPRSFQTYGVEHYFCVPALDVCMAPAKELIDAAQRVLKIPGNKYIHCANGHGRSALFIALCLILRNDVQDLTEARGLLKRGRPTINWEENQAECVEDALKLGSASKDNDEGGEVEMTRPLHSHQ